MAQGSHQETGECPQAIRALEFFSGLGAFHAALQQALGDRAILVESFEISDAANDVYQHNWGRRPYQGNIEALTVAQLDKYAADLWVLSPPCQPFTRQGLKKDVQDFRAAPFQALLGRLPLMKRPPRFMLVENVVGFERSLAHRRMLRTLWGCSYRTAGFLLSPEQYGCPNSRHRSYTLAIRLPAEHQDDVQLPWARFPFTATTQLAQPSSLPPAPAAASASPHASGGAPALPDRGVGSSQPAQHAEHAAARPAAGAGTADPGVEQEDEDDEEEEDEEAWRLEQRRHPIFVLPPYVLQQQQVPPAQPAAAGRGQAPAAHEQQGGLAAGPQPCTAEAAAVQAPVRPLAHYLVPRPCPHADVVSTSAQGSSLPAEPASTPDGVAGGDGDRGPPPQGGGAVGAAAGGGGGAEAAALGREWEAFRVPSRVLEQCGDVLHVVTPASDRSKTFTKSYTQKIKGSGSVLCTLPALRDRPDECARQCVHERAAAAAAGEAQQQQQAESSPKPGLHALAPVLDKRLMAAEWARMQLRFFTPREIANLHGLPASFGFPPATSLRQRYQLLGNSLHAGVVADLLALLLPPHACGAPAPPPTS